MVDNPNLTPWKKLTEQTASGETITKSDVQDAFSPKDATGTSVPSSSIGRYSGKATQTMTPGKMRAARLREQQDALDDDDASLPTDTPPLPTISLYGSDAYQQHTTVIGTPTTTPGVQESSVVDVPTTTAMIPKYSQSGGTATPQELQQVDHTRSSTGIISGDMYAQQEEQQRLQTAAQQAGVRAETRATTEIITPQQQDIQTESQNIYNREYTFLMDQRAEQLGIQKDQQTGQYIVESPKQWRLLMAYSGIASSKAKEKAQDYTVQQTRNLKEPTQARVLDIYQEEYGKEGLVVVQDPTTGKYQVMTQDQYQRQQVRDLLEERYSEMPLVERTARIAAETFLNVGNVGMWIDLVTKGPEKAYEHLMDYRTDIAFKRQEGDVVGALFATPTFTNIALPLGIGMGIGYAAPRTISAIASRSPTAGKIAQKTLQIGGSGLLATYIGTEAGMTAITGITQGIEKGIERGLEAGMRIGFGYLGARIGSNAEPIKTSVQKQTTEWIYNPEEGTFTGQRYINLFGKKIVWQRSPVTMQTRNILDIAGTPSATTGETTPFTGMNKWYTTTGTAWQPRTGIPLPGIYTGTQPSVWVAPKLTDKPFFGISGVPAIKTSFDFDLLTESQSSFMKNLYIKELQGKTPTTISEVFDAYQKKWETGIYKPSGPRKIKGKPEWRPSYKVDVDPTTGITEVMRGSDIFYRQPPEKPTPVTGLYWRTGRELSTKVWPKPKVYGAYETRFIIVDWTDFFKSLIVGRATKTGKPVVPKKQPHIYTIQDILKPEPIEGTPTGTGRQQQILKTKVKTQQKQELMLQQEYQLLQKQDYLTQMLQQEQATVTLTEKATAKQLGILYGVGTISAQKKSQKELLGFGTTEAIADAQSETQMMNLLFGQTQAQGQEQGVLKAQAKADSDATTLYTKGDYVFPPTNYDFFFKPKVPEPFIPFRETPPPTIPKEGGGLLTDKQLTMLFGEGQGYKAQVKKRMYQNGRKIRGTEWIDVDGKTYSQDDALAVASHVADNTAKRSIRVVPSKGKQMKRPKRINPWGEQMFEYKEKNNGVFVETNMFTIDSPGEIREISQRGWEARRKKGSKPHKSTKNQGLNIKFPSTKSIERRLFR